MLFDREQEPAKMLREWFADVSPVVALQSYFERKQNHDSDRRRSSKIASKNVDYHRKASKVLHWTVRI